MQAKIGQVWEQKKGNFIGRRGIISKIDRGLPQWGNVHYVTLDPRPGTCPCPARQVRTKIRMDRFLKEFSLLNSEVLV